MILHSAVYAALGGLGLVALAVNVVRERRAQQVALGDGAFALQRRVRAHGNFTEYTPIFLILLALAETQGLAAWAVHGFGLAFFAGRAMHAYSLLKAEQYVGEKITAFPQWRFRGMVCSFSCINLLAVILLGQFALA